MLTQAPVKIKVERLGSSPTCLERRCCQRGKERHQLPGKVKGDLENRMQFLHFTAEELKGRAAGKRCSSQVSAELGTGGGSLDSRGHIHPIRGRGSRRREQISSRTETVSLALRGSSGQAEC